jgi:hypothetical protein
MRRLLCNDAPKCWHRTSLKALLLKCAILDSGAGSPRNDDGSAHLPFSVVNFSCIAYLPHRHVFMQSLFTHLTLTPGCLSHPRVVRISSSASQMRSSGPLYLILSKLELRLISGSSRRYSCRDRGNWSCDDLVEQGLLRK